MLLTLSICNFRSFGTEATLDLQRRGFRTQHPRKDETWQENTWHRAAIFGANAAGKSNVLRALGQLKLAITHSLTNEHWVRELRDPHSLCTDEPTSFEVEYVFDDVRYRWGLTLNHSGVVEESLEANLSSRWRRIFERTGNSLIFGSNTGISHAAKENIEQFMRPWALVFSAWNTVKTPGPFAGALQWWQTLLPVIMSNEADHHNRHQWPVQLAQKDPTWLSVLQNVVAVPDVGINKIGIEEQAPDLVKQIELTIQPDGQAEITDQFDSDEITEYLRYLMFEHSDGIHTFSLPETQESQGTKAWMDLAIPALFALSVGGVLSIDEIDGSLHPLLVRELVSYFDNSELNPLGAQLLFSTHDLTLLGKYPAESLHRGEVWLVEKERSYSELIALDEFPIRDAHNIEKRYLQGTYGAVPISNTTELLHTLEVLREKYTKMKQQ
ncbi:AAA family ATPase [Corynebacterium diphtheriae]|uniref:AAA family ATPase n=1 Tax=Corynebacterium diphtheriae TaxID=1717 RepID=UPI000A1E0EFC|nr:ATP-binding protein [Corynebacterium diphtheriae]OSQ23719.1 phage resistance protein [Corynebacterium diphtheriae]